MVGLLKINWIS